MPNGRSANVRSHRRGGVRGRSPVVLVLGVVAVLAIVGVVAGWSHLRTHPCTGRDTATIDAAPAIQPILASLNADWAKSKPQVGGVCMAVTINAKDSALMALALGGRTWDTQAYGTAPDVWVPESSIWIQQASANATAQQLMPDLQPSLARSPNVIAMPKAEAVALGWPDKIKFDWPDIITDANEPNFWATVHSSAGAFKFVMTNPNTSTAGMLTLMSIADRDNDGSVETSGADDEGPNVRNLSLLLHKTPMVGDSADVLTGLAAIDAKAATPAAAGSAATAYVSAFPALEQDVIKYDETDPKAPLVALYPSSGGFDADNPYLILNHPSWGTAAGVTAAKAFLAYARSTTARATFQKNGFRDANRNGDAAFTNANGVIHSLDNYLPRQVIDPLSVTNTLLVWNAETRASNVLLVMDVSGSMDNIVDVTGGQSRLQLAKAAAIKAVGQFSADSTLGLWEFSTNLAGGKDYKSLVTIGPLGETLPTGKTRAQTLRTAINGLKSATNTALYNTIDAAQKTVEAAFNPNASNFVVVITDGQNDPTGSPGGAGLDLPELKVDLAKTRAGGKNVPIVTIGISKQADVKSLQDISHTSNGVFFDSNPGFDIESVLENALFGSINQS